MGGELMRRTSFSVEYQPVDIAFENNDLHSRKATLTAGTLAKIANPRNQQRRQGLQP